MNAHTTLLHALMFAGLATVSVAHAAPQVATGRTIFQNNCASCHTVDTGMAQMAGPGLFGVVGRKAAGVAGFNYSAALAKAGASGTVWTRDELDLFLLDPATGATANLTRDLHADHAPAWTPDGRALVFHSDRGDALDLGTDDTAEAARGGLDVRALGRASADLYLGLEQRAPRWMQRTGLEWLHRLLGDPRRMARRYLVEDVRFAVLLARELRSARRSAG